MIQTLEAVIDEQGAVRLLEDVHLSGARRALVTIFHDEPSDFPAETAILSETALGRDWNRPEEEAAWNHLKTDDDN